MSKKKSNVNLGILDPKSVAAAASCVGKAQQCFTDVKRLSGDDKQRMVKPQPGARDVITTLLALGDKFGVMPPDYSSDDTLADVEQARSLEPLLTGIQSLEATVKDAYFRSESQAWKDATVIYGMLKMAAAKTPALRDELKPIRKWFKATQGNAKIAKPSVSTVSPSPAPANANGDVTAAK